MLKKSPKKVKFLELLVVKSDLVFHGNIDPISKSCLQKKWGAKTLNSAQKISIQKIVRIQLIRKK